MRRTEKRQTGIATLLTTALALLALYLCLPAEARAQWATNGSDINNTNSGNVGVGTNTSAPSAKLDVKGATSDASAAGMRVRNSADANLLFVRNDGNVGIGTASPGAKLDITADSTATNTYAVGLNLTGTQSTGNTVGQVGGLFSPLYTAPAGNTLNSHVGVQAVPKHTGGGAITVQDGFLSIPVNASTGTITTQIGTSNIPYNLGSGTVSWMFGNSNQPVNNSSGSVTSMFGTYVQAQNNGTGTISNLYGVYVEAPINPSGTITNKYAFVSAAGAGNVGIGTTSPIRGLHVSGANATLGSEFILENTGMPADNRKFNLWGSSTQGAAGRFYLRLLNDAGSAATREFLAFDNATGNVGVGATGPAYKLDVAGPVRSSSGGFVFPDGSTQATASFGTVTGVAAGAGLSGGGSGGSLTLTNSDRGSAQNIFKNIANAAGATQFSAGSNNDSISFEGAGATTVSFNAAAKKVTISSTGGSSGWTELNGNLSPTTLSANVGVGTQAPGEKLTVYGGNLYAGGTGEWSSGGVRLANTNAGGGWRMAACDGNADANCPAGGVVVHQDGVATRMAFTPDGNVGVGTSSPLQRLQVGGNTPAAAAAPDAISLGATYSATAGANPKLRLFDDGSVGNVYGLGVSAGQLDLTVPAGARYVWSVGGAEKMRLDGAGNVTLAGSIAATYQDVAEWVPSTQKLSAGTVVVLDAGRVNHVVASASAYDTKVAGVVSEQPGVILGVGGEGKVKVATTGRVKVRVDATRAPVHIGDLVVTSDVEGMAMRSEPVTIGGRQFHAPGTIIGKALEPLEKGTGEILVLLSLQ